MSMSKAEAGRLGGLKVLAERGREWFREIGKKGMKSFADRYFNGSIADAMEYRRLKAHERHIGLKVAEKLDKQIAAGATIACEEVPILLDADDDILFQIKWQDKERVRADKASKDCAIPF